MKPLFHEKTLLKAISGDSPPDPTSKLAIVRKWIAALDAGVLDAVKEVSLHGDFLRDVFCDILGYKTIIQGEGRHWTLHAEANITDGGGSADGALGFFEAAESVKGGAKLKGRIIAPIELKGAANDLDRAMAGRKESAVEQGWRYANYTDGCRWIIVSNYRETRLYRPSKTPAFYERFLLKDLANPDTFRRFYCLLNAANLLPSPSDPDAPSRIDLLLRESGSAEEKITKSLYAEYKGTRTRLVQWFRDNLPDEGDGGVFVEKAQKILDRVLFIAFCEDRGLLPPNTIKNAHDHRDPYNPVSIWTRYKSVFRWVDTGNDDPPIPGYNGGLFQHDPVIDGRIELPDEICSELSAITRYDYDTDVSVEVLGHIFEQSVTDLEELQAAASGKPFDRKKGKRKTQGVYYTPAFVTQYIVDLALGGYLRRKEEALRQRVGLDAIPDTHSRKLKKAERDFWETYRDDVLKKARVLDPACGSGAFLIAAFDFLLAEYARVNNALASIDKGQMSLFDLNKTILNNNLFGVDLSNESVEITKLSLWLKTAERGKKLTFLDGNVRHGDSIVSDARVKADAFDWRGNFSHVFADGGFDVVIGNPPYVRQELLGPIKPYLEQHYRSYNGVADLYTYFYERGVSVLKPGGVLSFIVTNKWLKAGYGQALRQFFADHTVFEQILDFGHAKIFEDADVFPCIVSVRKPETGEGADKSKPVKPASDAPVVVCPVPREKLSDINLKQYVRQHGYEVPWARFSGKAWRLENPAVRELMRKIRSNGIPLNQYTSCNLSYGIKTGFNKAFLVDDALKKELTKADPSSEHIFVKYLRGQDIKRWYPQWGRMWMILFKSSGDFDWPWKNKNEQEAEKNFSMEYPSLFAHLKQYEENLKKRYDKGTFWWELRPCAYYDLFQKPKITIQCIAFHSRFSYDADNYFINNAATILPQIDYWSLACLHSPAMWYFSFRFFPHKKDEALAMDIPYVQKLPIPKPKEGKRTEAEEHVAQLIEFTKSNQQSQSDLLDWLTIEMAIEKPGNKLSDAASLDSDTFITEIKKRRPKTAPKLGIADIKRIREAYNETVPAMQRRNAEIFQHEKRLSDLVNQAYGLTPEEIDLMWKTAPPRMPLAG